MSDLLKGQTFTNTTGWQYAPAQGPGTFVFGAAPSYNITRLCGPSDTSGSKLCPLVADALRRHVGAARFADELESPEHAALLEDIAMQYSLTVFAPVDRAFSGDQRNLTSQEGNETQRTDDWGAYIVTGLWAFDDLVEELTRADRNLTTLS